MLYACWSFPFNERWWMHMDRSNSRHKCTRRRSLVAYNVRRSSNPRSHSQRRSEDVGQARQLEFLHTTSRYAGNKGRRRDHHRLRSKQERRKRKEYESRLLSEHCTRQDEELDRCICNESPWEYQRW